MTDNKKQTTHEVQEELEEIAPGVFMTKADAEKQRAYNAAHPRPVENITRSKAAPAHADKEKQTAQNAQEVTAENEQLSLFAEQTPEEQAAAVLAEIAKDLAEVEAIRSSPEYKAHDLLMKLDVIATLAERCSRPRAIKTVCQSAAEDAAELYELTGIAGFNAIADRLTAVAASALLETMDQTAAIFDRGQEEQAAQRAAAVINIDTSGIDPKLDPGAPEFDIEAWREMIFAVDENGETMTERTRRMIDERLGSLAKAAAEAMPKPADLSAALSGVAQSLSTAITENVRSTMHAAFDAISGFAEFLQSETFTAIKESVRSVSSYIAEHGTELKEFATAAAEAAQELESLYPFLLLEIEERNAAAPDAEPITIDDVLSLMEISGEPTTELNGEPIENPYISLIERAKQRKADYEAAQEITATAAQFEAELPILKSIIPTRHTMPNNALMNKLQKAPAINAGEFDLPVANEKGRRKEITATVKVSYDENATGIALTGANMTEYERQVSDAVVTLWLYGDDSHIMTSDMIYRTMTGQADGQAPQGQKGAITKFMKKWESVRITVDCTEEMRKRGITDKDGRPIRQFMFDEYYLNTRRVQVRSGGTNITAWQLLSKPVILSYCEMTNQLLTVPAKMLDIKEVTTNGRASTISLSNNDNRIAVKGNLLRQIQILKGKRRNKQDWSDIISLRKVFEEIGLTDADKYAKKKVRDYVFACLDYWKAENFIAGYKTCKKGNEITGVQIIL